MKTIRQIADELGVSKQAVHQKIKKEPLSIDLQPFISKSDNVVYIEDKGVERIKAAFASTVAVNVTSTDDNQIVAFLMEQLKEKDRQLATKDDQIAEKDKQIENLSTVLLAAQQTAAAAQALHAGTIKQLDSGEPSPDGRSAPIEADVTSKKNGFIARIFKKEK